MPKYNVLTVNRPLPPPTELMKSGGLYEMNDGDIYIFAQVDTNTYRLISLTNGNRWADRNSLRPGDHVPTDYTTIHSVTIESD